MVANHLLFHAWPRNRRMLAFDRSQPDLPIAMLQTLYVKDFAIVGEAEITFDIGMTVVTGETGAGKSLLVDALLLLAGSRADATMVRQGCERAELSATFDINARADLRDWLRAEELDDEDQCQLRRVIRSEGSSRAWINGRPVTLTQLSALGEKLIEIHGQHEHQALLDRGQQLALLDAFGAHSEVLAKVTGIAREWREVTARIAEVSKGHDHAERSDWLRHQLEELDRYALKPDELAALDETHRRLSNSGQLLQGCGGLGELLDGDSEFALSRLLTRAQGEAARLAALDPKNSELRELLDAARIQIDEAGDSLRRYQDSLDLDPARLAEIETQLSRLHELARKHRRPMAELSVLADELRSELTGLQAASASVIELNTRRDRLVTDYRSAADKLSKARRKAGTALSMAVSTLMGELGMVGGVFEAALESTDSATPEANGNERCEFLVSANAGQAPRALRKVASGGELSRISLAIEVAALGLDTVGTMVFDEVDAGIGGAIAEVVGQKLRRLASQRQVLCVTHLPQVAAQGHHHLRVSKQSTQTSTETQIDTLDGKPRREEIARMLGGIDITRETLAHAKQMLEFAQSG